MCLGLPEFRWESSLRGFELGNALKKILLGVSHRKTAASTPTMQRKTNTCLLARVLPVLACASAIYLPTSEAAAYPDVFYPVPPKCFGGEAKERFVEIGLLDMHVVSTTQELLDDAADEVYIETATSLPNPSNWQDMPFFPDRWPGGNTMIESEANSDWQWHPPIFSGWLEHDEEYEIAVAVLEDDNWVSSNFETAIVDGLHELIDELEQTPGDEAETTAEMLEVLADLVPDMFPNPPDDVIGLLRLRVRNHCGVHVTLVTPQIDEVFGILGNGWPFQDFREFRLTDTVYSVPWTTFGSGGSHYRSRIEVYSPTP